MSAGRQRGRELLLEIDLQASNLESIGPSRLHSLHSQYEARSDPLRRSCLLVPRSARSSDGWRECYTPRRTGFSCHNEPFASLLRICRREPALSTLRSCLKSSEEVAPIRISRASQIKTAARQTSLGITNTSTALPRMENVLHRIHVGNTKLNPDPEPRCNPRMREEQLTRSRQTPANIQKLRAALTHRAEQWTVR